MKTKSLIYRIGTAAMMSAGFLMSAPLLSSCSSDDTPQVEESDPNAAPTISLSISTPFLAGTSTRADGDREPNVNDEDKLDGTLNATALEAHITSIWLYAYQIVNGNPVLYLAQECTLPSPSTDVLDYRRILDGKTIPAGDYRFYVVANLDDYNSTIKPISEGFTLDETVLKQTKLTYSKTGYDLLTNTTTISKGLPMGAAAVDVKPVDGTPSTSASQSTDGTISIKSGSVSLRADMTFLCSAVRFTFLFDNTAPSYDETNKEWKQDQGFSYPYESFWPYELKLYNTYNESYLFENPSQSSLAKRYAQSTQGTNIMSRANRVEYPENIDDFVATPYTLDKDETTWAADCKKKTCYQGLIYIPENTATTNSDKTLMKLRAIFDTPYTTEAPETDTQYDIYLPNPNEDGCDDNVHPEDATNIAGENILKRGHFYDVIGKITSTGMAFYVKVKDWEDDAKDVFEF
jgi:hypothetical protein